MNTRRKRIDELEVGDILLPHQMEINKRSWKVIEIESVASRFFVKIEVLGKEYPTILYPKEPDEKIGDIIRLDSQADRSFTVLTKGEKE